MSGNRFTPRSIWPRRILQAAGIYNLAWGALVVFSPGTILALLDLDAPKPIQIWQCVGMIVGVYGVGYLLAASDPARHWPIVLVGLLGKVFGPLGLVWSVLQGTMSWHWFGTIVTNDVIWWLPLGVVLYYAFRQNNAPARNKPPFASLDEALRSVQSHRGATLRELSAGRGVLIIFLRHSGCVFCREALADLAAKRADIEASGVQLALVHMDAPLNASQMAARFELEDVHRFSDPDCRLYSVFGLRRAEFWQLFGWTVLKRGLRTAVVEGHGPGRISGDTFRLPGAFLLASGRMINAYRAKTAADRPDYIALTQGLKTDGTDTADLRPDGFARSLASVA